MGDGTKENPYTREDVLRLIKENGGRAKGLDLSEKIFEKGIDLRGLNNNHLQGITLDNARFPLSLRRDSPLRGANLKGVHLEGAHLLSTHLEEADLSDAYLEGARLWHAHLERAYLSSAHLEEANLRGAHLEEANLQSANLKGADLTGTHLEGAQLTDVRLSSDTKLHNVDWGSNYILAEERHGQLDWAEDTYRTLKVWHTQAGIYDIAGEFFFREMTVQRKRIRWWPLQHRLWSAVHSFVSGYGERPLRVIRFGALVLFVSTFFYYLFRGVAPYDLSAQSFLSSLYYSAVSFTALGYGPWFNNTSVHSWVQWAGAVEAFFGVFTIALFLVTFTRKMRR